MDFITNFMLLDTNSYLKFELFKRYKNSRAKKVNNKNKGTLKEFHRLFQRLLNNPDDFYEQTKMKSDTFFYILNSIRHQLLPKPNSDENIPPEGKLFITLRYLTTGLSFRSLAISFGLRIHIPRIIINETCNAIYSILANKHMPNPTEELFLKISQEFELLFNFPNCIGCIDSKYIRCKNQKQSDLPTYLQVIADANYKIINAEVITNDHNQIFSSSNIYNYLENKTFHVPPPVRVTQLNAELPFVLIGGRGYPLKQYLLRPYKIRNTIRKEEDELFNRKLMEARRPIECALSLLISKWGCLTSEMQSNFTDKIVIVTCLLHNITIDLEGIDEKTRSNIKDSHSRIGLMRTSKRFFNCPDKGALFTRNLFKQYILSKIQRSDSAPCEFNT